MLLLVQMRWVDLQTFSKWQYLTTMLVLYYILKVG
jgi:hypothetical protein